MLNKKSSLVMIAASIISVSAIAQSEYFMRIGESGVSNSKESCSIILSNEPGSSNGYYELYTGQYYCDMDNGGWTLLADIDYDIDKDDPNASPMLNYGPSSTDAFWANYPSNATNRKDIVFNGEGIRWSDAKFDLHFVYYRTVDSYDNKFKNSTITTDDNFFDGIVVKTESDVMGAFTKGDNESRREYLGIPDSRSFIGEGMYSVNYESSEKIDDSITLRAMTDQRASDEDVGFVSYKLWIK